MAFELLCEEFGAVVYVPSKMGVSIYVAKERATGLLMVSLL